MHGVLSFESDKNAFVAIGTLGFSVPLAVLKNRLDGDDFVVQGDHGRSVLIAIPVRLEDNVCSKQPESFYGADCYISKH